MPLDLLIPDLLATAGAPDEIRTTRLPALEKWLARADRSRHPGGRTAWIGVTWSLPDPVPVAAIELGREGLWLRADPVHLRVERQGVQLFAPAALGIAEDEAGALVDALNAHFGEDGLAFVASASDRWHVEVPAGELPRTIAPEQARGRDVARVFPEGGGRISWRRALTEAQMILGGHAVNERREMARKPAINSVWFWGGGALPARVASPYASIASGDAFLRGLGRLSNTPVTPAPAAIAEVPDARGGEARLVTLECLQAALDGGDAQAWRDAALRLERDWFAPLGAAIARFERVRLILPTAGDTLVATLVGAARWRLFRPARPLATYA